MAETVRVRVAVRVYASGFWGAYGFLDADADTIDDTLSYIGDEPDNGWTYWIWADLPLPTEPEVAASVEGEG